MKHEIRLRKDRPPRVADPYDSIELTEAVARSAEYLLSTSHWIDEDALADFMVEQVGVPEERREWIEGCASMTLRMLCEPAFDPVVRQMDAIRAELSRIPEPDETDVIH